jgi:hypothetical protein
VWFHAQAMCQLFQIQYSIAKAQQDLNKFLPELGDTPAFAEINDFILGKFSGLFSWPVPVTWSA